MEMQIFTQMDYQYPEMIVNKILSEKSNKKIKRIYYFSTFMMYIFFLVSFYIQLLFFRNGEAKHFIQDLILTYATFIFFIYELKKYFFRIIRLDENVIKYKAEILKEKNYDKVENLNFYFSANNKKNIKQTVLIYFLIFLLIMILIYSLITKNICSFYSFVFNPILLIYLIIIRLFCLFNSSIKKSDILRFEHDEFTKEIRLIENQKKNRPNNRKFMMLLYLLYIIFIDFFAFYALNYTFSLYTFLSLLIFNLILFDSIICINVKEINKRIIFIYNCLVTGFIIIVVVWKIILNIFMILH